MSGRTEDPTWLEDRIDPRLINKYRAEDGLLLLLGAGVGVEEPTFLFLYTLLRPLVTEMLHVGFQKN